MLLTLDLSSAFLSIAFLGHIFHIRTQNCVRVLRFLHTNAHTHIHTHTTHTHTQSQSPFPVLPQTPNPTTGYDFAGYFNLFSQYTANMALQYCCVPERELVSEPTVPPVWCMEIWNRTIAVGCGNGQVEVCLFLMVVTLLPVLFPIHKKKKKTKERRNALAGSRTRIYCLEGNNANRYTTNA